MDVVEVFSGLTAGQKNNLNRAIRALFNFLESQGWNKDWLDSLRKNVPGDQIGIDVKVPSEARIISSLQAMGRLAAEYNTLYNLVLDSGLRLTEAVRFSNDFSEAEIQQMNEILTAPLGYFRSSKIAYYAFFTRSTLEMLRRQPRDIVYINASSYTKKFRRRVVSWKYLRKFAFDKMIELEIPESVADFIQGRVAKKIGATNAGTIFFAPFSDSTTGVQVRKADDTTVVLDVVFLDEGGRWRHIVGLKASFWRYVGRGGVLQSWRCGCGSNATRGQGWLLPVRGRSRARLRRL